MQREFVKYRVPVTNWIEQICLIELYHTLGEMNKNRQPNFMVVNTETPMSDIEGKHYLYSIYSKVKLLGYFRLSTTN